MSLLGGRILVTRSEGGWEDLVRRVAASGGRVEFRAPTISAPPADPAPAQAAIARIAHVSWIVLTSVRGVVAFADALGAPGERRAPFAGRTACVGPATARVAAERGFDVALVAVDGRGASLAAELRRRLEREDIVLVVRPETGTLFPAEELSGAAASVDSVAFYRTCPSSQAAAIAIDLSAGLYDAAVVTAPSAIHALSAESLRGVKRVAIGASTADALGRAGVPADAIATLPTSGAVADALESL